MVGLEGPAAATRVAKASRDDFELHIACFFCNFEHCELFE